MSMKKRKKSEQASELGDEGSDLYIGSLEGVGDASTLNVKILYVNNVNQRRKRRR